MKAPTPHVRETILKALEYMADAEPSDDPAEEQRDDRRRAAALAWIQGHKPLPSL